MDAQIVGAVVGAVASLAGVLLWERLMRPALARQAVCRLLAAEVSQNLQFAAVHEIAHKQGMNGIPADLFMMTFNRDAAGGEIAHLPSDLVGPVTHLYGRFEWLNRTVVGYGNLHTRWQSVANQGEKRALEDEMDASIEAFYRMLRGTVSVCNHVLPRLRAEEQLWRPPWKRRVISIEELEKAVRDAMEERKTALAARRITTPSVSKKQQRRER